MRWGPLLVYGSILAIVWGLARPGSAAGKAVTDVSGALAGTLNQGLTTIGG